MIKNCGCKFYNPLGLLFFRKSRFKNDELKLLLNKHRLQTEIAFQVSIYFQARQKCNVSRRLEFEGEFD